MFSHEVVAKIFASLTYVSDLVAVTVFDLVYCPCLSSGLYLFLTFVSSCYTLHNSP